MNESPRILRILVFACTCSDGLGSKARMDVLFRYTVRLYLDSEANSLGKKHEYRVGRELLFICIIYI